MSATRYSRTHWLPLAIVGRTRRYSLARVARLSSAAGLAHVLVSLVLGGVIVVIGLQFRSSIESAQSAIVGSLLIATAVVVMLVDVLRVGHRHSHDGDHTHSHGHAHEHAEAGTRSLIPFMVSFGAAASPDLTILPVFLAATAAGVGAAVGSLIVFGLVTVATFVILTLAATVGGYRVGGQWLEKRGNLLTAGMLLVIGVLVLVGVI